MSDLESKLQNALSEVKGPPEIAAQLAAITLQKSVPESVALHWIHHHRPDEPWSCQSFDRRCESYLKALVELERRP